MNKNKHRLIDNIFSLTVLQFMSYIIPLVTLPYLSRVLGAELFGLVFFALAFIQYFTILTDYGFGLSATREIAINRHNLNSLSNIFSSVMFIKFMLIIISFIILCLTIILIPKLHENWLIFSLTFFMVIGNALLPVWFFQGIERMKYITFLDVTAKLIFLGLIFLFVKSKGCYFLVPLFNSLGFLVSGIIGIYIAIKKFSIKIYIPKWKSIKKQLKYSSEFFLSRASLSIYTNTNTFSLGIISSNITVGYFVAAEKIYLALDSLFIPLSNALYPYIAKLKDIKTYTKILTYACILNIIICSFVFIYAKDIVTIIYGQELINSYKVLRILCCVVLIDTPSILIGYPLLGALGHANVANVSVIVGATIHLIGLVFLFITEKLNIYSVATMLLITESVVFFIRIYAVFKYKLIKNTYNSPATL